MGFAVGKGRGQLVFWQKKMEGLLMGLCRDWPVCAHPSRELETSRSEQADPTDFPFPSLIFARSCGYLGCSLPVMGTPRGQCPAQPQGW